MSKGHSALLASRQAGYGSHSKLPWHPEWAQLRPVVLRWLACNIGGESRLMLISSPACVGANKARLQYYLYNTRIYVQTCFVEQPTSFICTFYCRIVTCHCRKLFYLWIYDIIILRGKESSLIGKANNSSNWHIDILNGFRVKGVNTWLLLLGKKGVNTYWETGG